MKFIKRHLQITLIASLLGSNYLPEQISLVHTQYRIKARTNNFVAQAQENDSIGLDFVPRDLTAKDDAPGDRTTKPDYGEEKCSPVEKPLTALVPGFKNDSLRALTSQENPIFWFYVPYNASGLSVEFQLVDYQDEEVYREQFSLTGTPGIIRISLPPTVGLLQLNQDYFWSLTVICNSQQENIYVTGKYQRVIPNFDDISSLTGTPEERLIIYAKDGLWHESLTTILTEIMPLDPQKGKAILTEFLKDPDIDLEELAEEKLTECCS
ncbi:DUF928 domain-containing protein [Oscillatoria salina]|uniref:DUF928 domain-containing protein n=1 Tax=Oscillatoria salina TaxID=331517 RepID=UPI001CC91885|nr:DUF928 domain-containing protein [Oscillatoria salina]MBZ8180849.1 DUF928 domain-containing protein [Oscillatoria salina IIICB1]